MRERVIHFLTFLEWLDSSKWYPEWYPPSSNIIKNEGNQTIANLQANCFPWRQTQTNVNIEGLPDQCPVIGAHNYRLTCRAENLQYQAAGPSSTRH